MLPVPRAQALPGGAARALAPGDRGTRRMSPRRSRSSRDADDRDAGRGQGGLALGHRPPARSSASRPGAQQAWTALPRFIISLRCFQAITSGRGSETNPASRKAAATASLVASVPPGSGRRRGCPGPAPSAARRHRARGGRSASSRRRPGRPRRTAAASGSLATPFCSDTTGVEAGSTEVRSSTAVCVWWLLTVSSTVTGSPAPASRASRASPAAGTSIVRVPAGTPGSARRGGARRGVARARPAPRRGRPRAAVRRAPRRSPRRRTPSIA